MTYSTLASIVKYPYSSELSGGKINLVFLHRKKMITDVLPMILVS